MGKLDSESSVSMPSQRRHFTFSKSDKIDEKVRRKQLVSASRARKPSLWHTICAEVAAEISEFDIILEKLGHPGFNYRKDKTFPQPTTKIETTESGEGSEIWTEERDTCNSRIYLEKYIFPYVLPAIQSLIEYCKKNRVFQCKACIFEPMDYIVEYLYNNNNNMTHPERRVRIVPIYDIPFANQWLMKYPRPPYPRFLTMSEEEAARIIQRCVRMWLARKKVQDLRFKRDFKFVDRKKEELGEREPPVILSPYYDEMMGGEDHLDFVTHSQDCFVCQRFKMFLQEDEEKRRAETVKRTSSYISIKGEDE